MYEDPLQLFSEALAAVDREDWLGLACMCDPVSLRVFRQQHLQGLEHDLRAPTADDYLRHDPDMPREVAEYQARQAGRYADPDLRAQRDFPTVGSVAEMRLLGPTEFFAAWLQGRSLRAQIEAEAEARQLPPEAVPVLLAERTQHFPRPQVLGTVADGPEFTHIVHRLSFDEGAAADAESAEEQFENAVAVRRFIQVETVRKGPDGGWFLIADSNLLGMSTVAFAAWTEEAADEDR